MGEHHRITDAARGEPLPADQVGACVRVPLDAPPSPHWSRALAGHLAAGLTGHPAVGYLRLDRVVQGSEIVLDGVEEREAGLLGPVLRSAIEAANRACEHDERRHVPPLNMKAAEAQGVARRLTESLGDGER